MEVFSGSGSLSKRFARCHWNVIVRDVLIDPMHDITLPSGLDDLKEIVDTNDVENNHQGVECSTFSGASFGHYRCPEFPNGYPCGHARHCPLKLAKTLLHNDMADRAADFFDWTAQKGIISTLENPLPSQLWKRPKYVALIQMYGPLVRIYYCNHGRLYAKAIGLLVANCDGLRALDKTCRCTGKHAESLSRWSRDENQVQRDTKDSNSYPASLTRRWVAITNRHLDGR